MLRKTLPNWTSQALLCRQMSVVARSLKYSQHGEPQDVLKLVEDRLADPKDKQVLVKILAAPINPADINTIQGKSAWSLRLIFILYKHLCTNCRQISREAKVSGHSRQ